MTYAIAKQAKFAVEAMHDAAAAVLNEVSGTERGPMGLTPDHIKATPEWKAAYRAERKAFNELRSYNGWFAKSFKKEMRADPTFNRHLRLA